MGFERIRLFRHKTLLTVGFVTMLLSCAPSSFAQQQAQEKFPSAADAAQKLFLAVQSDNEQAMAQILGGGREIVSSGDALDDREDRKLFVDKYQEMHRLVQEADGTTTLYIGAENWPFPIPLLSNAGQWYFDAQSGAKEILFRRIGENEFTAVETCHALAAAGKPGVSQGINDADVVQYARTLLNGQEARPDTNINKQPSPLFHGYYFHRLLEPGKAGAEPAFLAYPAEYGSSGVMTFVVTQENLLYERDLGPDTATVAKNMTKWKPGDKWKLAE